MKKTLLAMAVTATLPLSAFADVTVYGKANVAVQSADEGGDAVTEVVSNASRIGVKGKEKLSDSLTAIYKFEYETQIDDGDKSGQTFSQRNIYVGLQGDFGQVIVGKFDTPLKTAQKKVDLFNDLEGDIKSVLTGNDNRTSNNIQYTTPKSLGDIQAKIAYVASENDDVDSGISTSVAYNTKPVYVAVAYDQDVEGEGVDVIRLVGQFNVGDFQLGALWEEEDKPGQSSNDGYVVSAKYKISKEMALKAQWGESDMEVEGAETYSLGLDYKLSKNTKVFGYYTDEKADGGLNNDYLGLGLEVKF